MPRISTKRSKFITACWCWFALVCAAPVAKAQVQRSFINGSFETPQIGDPVGTGVCQGYIYANRVPGWLTTDQTLTSPTADFDNPNGCNNNPEPTTGTQVFEFYTTGVVDNTAGFSRNAAHGRNYAELNAHTASRLYQNMCVVAGGTINFSFSHLGRRSRATQDVARLQIGGTPAIGSGQTVVTVGTNNNGSSSSITPGLSSNTTSVASPSAGGRRNWRTYSGSFVVPAGLNGAQEIAFEAVRASGGTAQGNFLDNVVITFSPLIELASATYTSTEGSTPYPAIQFRVAGVIPAGGVNVSVSRAGGTATLGTDYTINGGSAANFTFNIPAGDYGTGTLVSTGIAVGVIDDAVMESSETFTLRLNPGTGYTIGSTASCGAEATTSTVYTINDNDATITITKDAVPNSAQDFAFTTTGTGLSAFSLDDDADPTLPDTRSFVVAAGNYTVTETAVSGWSLSALTCTDPTSNSSGNIGTRTATINAAVGETVSCTFTNNSTSADLSITKTNNTTSVVRGQTTTYAVTVTNNGPAAANGAVASDTPGAGLTSCSVVGTPTVTGGAVAPAAPGALLTGGVAIPTLPAGGTVTFNVRCTVQ